MTDRDYARLIAQVAQGHSETLRILLTIVRDCPYGESVVSTLNRFDIRGERVANIFNVVFNSDFVQFALAFRAAV